MGNSECQWESSAEGSQQSQGMLQEGLLEGCLSSSRGMVQQKEHVKI